MSNKLQPILDDVQRFNIRSAIEYLLQTNDSINPTDIQKRKEVLQNIQNRFFPQNEEVISINLPDESTKSQLFEIMAEKDLTFQQLVIQTLEAEIECMEERHAQDSQEENSQLS
jgi:hypothetical protein